MVARATARSISTALYQSFDMSFFQMHTMTKTRPPAASPIGVAGICLVPAVGQVPGFLTSASPLPSGSVRVHGQGGGLPTDIEGEFMTLEVFSLDGRPLFRHVVQGRDGLNDLYLDLVGYRPDEDDHEPDAQKLLAFILEVAYRNVTGDAN